MWEILLFWLLLWFHCHRFAIEEFHVRMVFFQKVIQRKWLQPTKHQLYWRYLGQIVKKFQGANTSKCQHLVRSAIFWCLMSPTLLYKAQNQRFWPLHLQTLYYWAWGHNEWLFLSKLKDNWELKKAIWWYILLLFILNKHVF